MCLRLFVTFVALLLSHQAPHPHSSSARSHSASTTTFLQNLISQDSLDPAFHVKPELDNAQLHHILISLSHPLKMTKIVSYEVLPKTDASKTNQIDHFGIFHKLLSNLQLTCLVTLFDRKLQIFQKLAKLTILAFPMNFCPIKLCF